MRSEPRPPGARVNTISPGIIVTPLAKERAEWPSRRGVPSHDQPLPGRAGTPDEVGALGAFLMSANGAVHHGERLLIDGGVTASYFTVSLHLSERPNRGDHEPIPRSSEAGTPKTWEDRARVRGLLEAEVPQVGDVVRRDLCRRHDDLRRDFGFEEVGHALTKGDEPGEVHR